MTSATGALSFGFRTEALEAALLSLGRIALARLPVKYDFHKSLQPVESNGVQVATFQPNLDVRACVNMFQHLLGGTWLNR